MPMVDVGELKEWVQNWFYMNRNYHPYSRSNDIPIPELYDILERMPKTDVIRCADCVHCQYDAIYGDRWCDGRRVKPDGYCSYGKRKSDLSLGTDNSEPHVELEPITGEYNRYHGELDVRNGKLTIYGSDRCVCCGAVVPEGRMVCPVCERRANE